MVWSIRFLFLFSLFLSAFGSQATSTKLILDDTSSAVNTVYTTQCGQYSYFQVYFPYACRDFNVTVTPIQGEPDVFVSINVEYPSNTDLTWAATATGEYIVHVSHWSPNSSPGEYYISVYDDCSLQSYQAKYTITVISFDGETWDDIYLNPAVSTNQITTALAYRYFKFCVPECSDVVVTLENCLSDEECPGAYSFPELLVSRTDKTPTIYDYTFKLAQIVRRYIYVNHSDPAARDRQGYQPGSYYVGVYGWCTPDQYVLNNATDGPCSYITNVLFNVTVEVIPKPTNSCLASHLIYPSEPNYPLLEPDITYRGYIECNDYLYYSIEVPSPCYNLNIFTETTYEGDIKAAELAVGKYPVVTPTFANLEWTSYDWGSQNLTISAWDPNFDGGYICGPDGKSLCIMYIGVFGYCVDDYSFPVEFEITASLDRAHKIYDDPQVHQSIAAHGKNYYEFCVDTERDVTAQLLTWTDSCTCPTSYTDLEMVISKTEQNAGIDDLVWRVEHTNAGYKEITLRTTDVATRPGTYYLNVLGYCQDSCADPCTCAPCSNLNNTQYALFVNETEVSDTYLANQDKYLGTSCGETSTECSEACSTSDSDTSSSHSNKKPSTKVIIAVSVVVIVVVLFAILITVYYVNKNTIFSASRYGSTTNDDGEATDTTALPRSTGGSDIQLSKL